MLVTFAPAMTDGMKMLSIVPVQPVIVACVPDMVYSRLAK